MLEYILEKLLYLIYLINMGNEQSYTALNSKEWIYESKKNWLNSEFNKEKNIVGKLPDIGELIRVEDKSNGWKHYYFNIEGFFDPDIGFLKVLVDIYQRYNEIKLDAKEIMPFSSLIFQPLDKIQEILEIKPGSFLDYSLGILYSFVISGAINLTMVLVTTRIHPIAGLAVGAAAVGIFAYEAYKGFKEIKREKFIRDETNLLITKILGLFGDGCDKYLTTCNIIEIKIDESFNSLIDGLFNYNSKNKVIINFWKLSDITKAKEFHNLSEKNQKIYSVIFEKMREFKNDKDFYEIYDYLGKKYRETYKRSKSVVEDNSKYKLKEQKRKEIFNKIDEYEKANSSDPRIRELYKELRELDDN